MLGTSEIKGSGLTFDAVTCFAEKHWDLYAKRCVSSFDEMWEDVPLMQMNDHFLEVNSNWLADFKQRNAHRPTNNYRLDAVRFAHKVAAIELAYEHGKADTLIWMDADCYTHSPVDTGWLHSMIDGADLAILNRTNKYTETGFMMFRRGMECNALISGMVAFYETDRIFELKEWHDCWVLDHVRSKLNINTASLSGDAAGTGHPLVNGPLGERLDHLKGKRKQLGKSLRSDLKSPRKELYWK